MGLWYKGGEQRWREHRSLAVEPPSSQALDLVPDSGALDYPFKRTHPGKTSAEDRALLFVMVQLSSCWEALTADITKLVDSAFCFD